MDYNNLSGLDKAAVLFQILGEPLAVSFFTDLAKEEILKIRVRSNELSGQIPTIVKKQILDASAGRNTSYKIPLDNGTVRINRCKESINYSFDSKKFEELDNQTKDKFLKEEVVKAKLNYSLDTTKIESIKSKSEFKELNDLIEEHRKDAHFTVSFWQNKNNDPIQNKPTQKDNLMDNIKNESLFKKWIKKIF